MSIKENELRGKLIAARASARKGTKKDELVDIVDETSSPAVPYELKLTAGVDLDQLARQQAAAKEQGHEDVRVAVPEKIDGYCAQRAGFAVVLLGDLCDSWRVRNARKVKKKIDEAAKNSPNVAPRRRFLNMVQAFDAVRAMNGGCPVIDAVVEDSEQGRPTITISQPATPLAGTAFEGDVFAIAQIEQRGGGIVGKLGIALWSDPTDEACTMINHLLTRVELSTLKEQLARGQAAYDEWWRLASLVFLGAAEEELAANQIQLKTNGTAGPSSLPGKYRYGYKTSYAGIEVALQASMSDVDFLKGIHSAVHAGIGRLRPLN